MAPLEEKMLLVLSAPRKILGFWSSVPGTGAGWGVIYIFSSLAPLHIHFLGSRVGSALFPTRPFCLTQNRCSVNIC